MRVSIIVFSMLTFFALAVVPAMADEMISFKAGYLSLSPEGEFAVSGIAGEDRVDMEDDLGFDDSEEFMAEAAVQLGSFRLTAGYLPLKFSGDGTLSRTIGFGGRTFSFGERVKSDVDIDLYDVGLTWYLLNFDDLPVRLQLGPEVSVKYVDADISMQSSTASESESVSAPVPTIGLRGRVGISDFLGLVGRVGYLEFDDNSFLDADVQLEFSPLPLVGIFAGYRYLDIEVDESDVFLDVTFDGPYGGAFIRF
jgi:outer membrane protein